MTRILVCLALLMTAAHAHAGPDPHSYSNHDQLRVRHLQLDLSVDFAARELHGFADLSVERLDPAARELRLDTRNLRIERVLNVDATGAYREVRASLGAVDPILGSALRIPFGVDDRRVRIYYRSAPEASGLQWLEPRLTAGKKHPFLFSQSQAIHARSWVPIQDAPAVRFSYAAHVRTPEGLLARMSAVNQPDDAADGDYRFDMPQPIPAYLLAIAVGELEFAPLGERSGVYAEPSMLAAAAREFADTERMIEITEALYGPYRWGRYDLLVLPPSFPFGGMENPRLTFLTPTVIAGDRSLVSLIAHELAHSWSGNLVTNIDWNHFWLNEGFTTYVENRIVEATFGADRAAMERVLSEADLDEELAGLASADQHLRLDLRGRDPDEGMNEVAYTKGMRFLRLLELRFGREAFDPFLRAWFDEHAFKSASTDDFLAFLRSRLMAAHPGKLSEAEIAAFVDAPGVPAAAQASESQRLAAVDSARNQWLRGAEDVAVAGTAEWTPQEWIRFIEGLPADVPLSRLRALDARYALRSTGNSEVAFAWYRLAIQRSDAEVFPAIEAFLSRIGRRKFVLPLYQALMANPAHHDFARRVYAAARPGYHPITQASIDPVVTGG